MEGFQPMSVRPPSENWLLFWARCLGDLQLLTIYLFLRVSLSSWRGRVLDVGAGRSPWRDLMAGVDYVGADTIQSDAFGMSPRSDIVYYDGRNLPFEDASFDHVLCIEVLEHVAEPRPFLVDLQRVLRPAGTLALTVPWSARIHHLPHDYHRFTRFALLDLLTSAGFGEVVIRERGNDVAAISNKMLVWWLSLVRHASLSRILTWIVAVLLAPIVAAFLVLAHLTLIFGWGSRNDPLGYGLTATKLALRESSGTLQP